MMLQTANAAISDTKCWNVRLLAVADFNARWRRRIVGRAVFVQQVPFWVTVNTRENVGGDDNWSNVVKPTVSSRINPEIDEIKKKKKRVSNYKN